MCFLSTVGTARRRQMSKERSHLDLLRVAGRQHGALSRAQALASGMSPSSVDRRIASGQLKVILPGIYTVLGVPSSWHQRVMAACLWAGAGAVASHQTAGALWALARIQQGSVEITTPRRLRSQQASVHQSRLGPGETTVVGRIPVTDVARTLLDLGAAMPEDHVEISMTRYVGAWSLWEECAGVSKTWDPEAPGIGNIAQAACRSRRRRCRGKCARSAAHPSVATS
jgi:hypothetical protein